MSDTYTQIHIQYVFSVKDRECLLLPEWRSQIFEYMSGIIKARGHKPIIVGGYYDHVHVFVGFRPDMKISDLIRDIKNLSSNFINDHKLVRGKFSWQEGYGAFSYSKSQVQGVYQYILNQEEHHKKRSFKDEYIQILNQLQIQYNEKYLFDWIMYDH